MGMNVSSRERKMFKEPSHSQPSAPSSKLKKMLFALETVEAQLQTLCIREVVGITLPTAPRLHKSSYCCRHHLSCFQEQLSSPGCSKRMLSSAMAPSCKQAFHLRLRAHPVSALLIVLPVSFPFLATILCVLLLSPFCFLSRVHYGVPTVH